MTKYYVPLTEQETLSLRQLATQPGYEVIFKLLQMESLDAQSAAMECTEPDRNKRLLLLSDAQATSKVVSNLIKRLASYQNVIQQTEEIDDRLLSDFNVFDQRSN